MYAIPSSLTKQNQEYEKVKDSLSGYGFVLGGNWAYDHGSFDCVLDEANKVWLRLPFDVTLGRLDSESQQDDTLISFGQPFVLKHVYNEGLDREAQPRTLGALVDQFSTPVDADDEIETQWIDLARQKLNEVEAIYPA